MRIDRRTLRWLRLNSFVMGIGFLAVLVLAAWLSTRYTVAVEWSTTGGGELSDSSVELLEGMDEPLEVVAFVRPDDFLAGHIERLVERYQRHHPDLRFRAINPDARPELVRQFGVEGQGEMVVEYRGRQEQVAAPSEQRLSAAIGRLAHADGRPVVYPVEHGERDLAGDANHDLGSFGGYLDERGHELSALNAGDGVPDDASLLVVAGPRSDWAPPLRDAVTDWVDAGGNLLWLVDEDDRERLDFLAEALGIAILPGIIIEPQAEALLGVDDPRLLLLADYPRHPALDRLDGMALFVGARALELGDTAHEQWQVSQLLRSDERHWIELQDPDNPSFDAAAGERRGPLSVALTLSRTGANDAEQRVAVVGDADFLSNAYVGNGDNLQLGMQLVDWLTDGSGAGAMPGRAAPDQTLELTRTHTIAIGVGLLLVLPGLWLLGAGWAWWRRVRG
ncbi:Gldg family protein [Aquisalimonas sp.]|uniref:GldG family protein n=1 Tax=unclassified Aquisalimonas TaxID=2644645 RepID=UPI0025BD448E|nr:Gldg family protein [Aquisalimonas sp.]